MNFFPDFAPNEIPENSGVCRFFNQICENKSDICRKFWICENYSLFFKSIHFTPQCRCVRGSDARAASASKEGPSILPRAPLRTVPPLVSLGFGKISKFCKFLPGSFSAVSRRNFARKHAFDSICQALQDLHTFAPLQSQNFRKKLVWKIIDFRENSATFLQMLLNLQNLLNFKFSVR